MNFNNACEAAVVVSVNGTEFKFPKPKRRAIGELSKRWAAQDRERMKALHAEIELPIEKQYEELKRFDDESRMVSFAYGCLYQFDRALEALLLSIQIDNPNATLDTVDALPFPPDEIVVIACETWGMKRRREYETQSGEGAEKKIENSTTTSPTPSSSPPTESIPTT